MSGRRRQVHRQPVQVRRPSLLVSTYKFQIMFATFRTKLVAVITYRFGNFYLSVCMSVCILLVNPLGGLVYKFLVSFSILNND